MGAATSKDMAAATLVLLPLNVVTLFMRLWIRVQRSAWGADDWAMVATIPVWLISQVGLLGMAWSGVGQLDSTLTRQQNMDSLFWFYVFQEFWCFTLVALKWCLGFTLLRIANDARWVQIIIYSCLFLVTVCTGGTGMYLFFQCSPVEKNWDTSLTGECKPREIQTALSFLVAAVSITTDWIFAILPFALLWKLQMPRRVKASVIGLLGLGFFASIAPIVRLNYLLLMNDTSRFLEALGIILAWAQAEVGIGMLVANLPACRPLLERTFSRMTGSRNNKSTGGGGGNNGNGNKSYTGGGGGIKTIGGGTMDLEPALGSSSTGGKGQVGNSSYFELDEHDANDNISPSNKKKNKFSFSKSNGGGGGNGQFGIETRVYGRDMNDGDSSIESLVDYRGQKSFIVSNSGNGNGKGYKKQQGSFAGGAGNGGGGGGGGGGMGMIRVQRQIAVTDSPAMPSPSR